MSENGKMKFSLKVKQIPIEMEGEDGVISTYTLKELKGTGRDKFLNLVANRMKVNDKGEPIGIKNADGQCSDLLSLCLHDPQGKLLNAAAIQEFPSSTQMELFKMAVKLSKLAKEDEELAEAKND